MEFHFEKKIDLTKMRYFIDEECFAVHCQYYLVALTKLANDSIMLDGPSLMEEASRESFYQIFKHRLTHNPLKNNEEKINYFEEYFYQIGLGILKINIEENTALLENSCINASWLKKYKTKINNVNYIASGYISAAFAILNKKPINYYSAEEKELIIENKNVSKFRIKVKEDELT